MTYREASEIAGTLSEPGKMPGFAYSLPAAECKVGARLARVEGSVCFNCYALRGRYRMPAVQAALEKRLASLDDPRWVDALVSMISVKARSGRTWFRWHDSGDLQSVAHLCKIVSVCEQTPSVRHWLPTREYAIVREYLGTGRAFPENLTVRLSAHMVDGPPAPAVGLPRSAVHAGEPKDGVWSCPAATPEHRRFNKDGSPSCGTCRACWDPTVETVSYPQH